jgi:hypothetical protein
VNALSFLFARFGGVLRRCCWLTGFILRVLRTRSVYAIRGKWFGPAGSWGRKRRFDIPSSEKRPDYMIWNVGKTLKVLGKEDALWERSHAREWTDIMRRRTHRNTIRRPSRALGHFQHGSPEEEMWWQHAETGIFSSNGISRTVKSIFEFDILNLQRCTQNVVTATL